MLVQFCEYIQIHNRWLFFKIRIWWIWDKYAEEDYASSAAKEEDLICEYINGYRSVGHDVVVKYEIDKLSQLLPIYLSTINFYHKKGITSSSHPRYNIQTPSDAFELIYVDNIPQQKSGSIDCGLFVIAYAEFLIGGEGIPNSSIDAELLRNRYASILWDYLTKKIEADSMSDDEASPRKIRPIVDSSSSYRIELS
ncbi:hypothetical protein HAX54_028357 [Datura stramonium]|uniref:Ubiquitin-like protease family profile domain-containing protein n=1 Tax=Datura stramonium TaxID=4076 RepID=A0ABS8V411_DATST|nr:hypothetical protein [Datura stramonium]